MDPNNTNNSVNISQAMPPPVVSTVPNISNVPVPNVTNTAPQNFDTTPERPKSKIWKWIGIAAGVFVAIGILIFVLVFTLTAAPVRVANEQFNNIRQNNLQAAYDLFSINAKTQVSFDDLQAFVLKYHLADAETASISFSGRQVNGNTATLDGKITINGSVANLRYSLVKENGVWKVFAFEVIPQ